MNVAGTQALVRAGSNHSSLSAEENIELSPAGRNMLAPQLLCRARALVDHTPNIYDKDALRYKVRSHFSSQLSQNTYSTASYIYIFLSLTERRHY